MDSQAIRSSQTPGALRKLLKLADDVPIVVLIGNVTPRKGHESFIRAAELVIAKVPRVRFVIVGREVDPPIGSSFLAQMQTLVKERRLDEHVAFTGELTNASRYLSDCNILCMPTIPWGTNPGEGFGLVLLEAMAVGLPAVATICGAPPEIIEHDVSGKLVPPGDSEAIAEAIVDLLTSDERRESIGRAGQKVACERFSAENMARSMESVYQKVAAARL